MSEAILFYRPGDPYGCFSNFYSAPLVFQGKQYPTSEHAFQAMKFTKTDPDWAEAIRLAPRARDAAQMGRDRSHPMRADWDNIRDDAMRAVLLAKFMANPSLESILVGTCDTPLVEHTERDSYWGDGGNGTGQNKLGKLLMEVRGVLGNCMSQDGAEMMAAYTAKALRSLV